LRQLWVRKAKRSHAPAAALTQCHLFRAGIEALPDELREGRRVQRIANVLNRKHRAAQSVAAAPVCFAISYVAALQIHWSRLQQPVRARVLPPAAV
jgi:hypothetical protein